MAKQNKFNFKGIEKKARTTLENAMVEIGNAAKSFFVENFRKQGFDDKNVEKWQPRKKADKRAGRAILVKTGDLRRSIIRNPANRAALSVKISTDLVYAARHNNGLKGMPKRQFMGDSYNLNERIKKIIVKRLDKTFK
jgi:phage gpG-like protein